MTVEDKVKKIFKTMTDKKWSNQDALARQIYAKCYKEYLKAKLRGEIK